ncbi:MULTISPECIES: hypothetical protein [Luteimonas]|uniref:General secretion pathway protein GspN n=1 Tax=Luteimonas chenhongjianii TaxID=2006110 RepID=A0A290XCQ6_9GAMM|nr:MULTISPECIES: hypothetical protein [Luteimonas]ATD66900.1 hypothetical protein CNR27_05120 [Luteimonas chenhongjianii]RPD84511.1 hypothetical protein EGK76_12370 [Luteimonas sp. 100069]
MRIDASNARTVLLAAVGGWALVFAALSLAGLGSRIGTLEDDGSALAAPVAAVAPMPPAPPLSAFGEFASRPLFSGDRRPHPFFIDPQDEGEGEGAGFDYVLTSVLRTPDFAMAILQPGDGGDPVRLKIGEAPPAASTWQLETVDARSVVFTTPEGPRTLELRVFDGIGGEPPTPMAPTALPVGRAPQAVARQAALQDEANAAVQRAAEAAAVAARSRQPGTPQARPQVSRQAAPQVEASGAASSESAPAAGPSEAQVEAIRRRIEERRARLRQQQQSNPVQTP